VLLKHSRRDLDDFVMHILKRPLHGDGIRFSSGPSIHSLYRVGLTLRFTTLPKTVRPSSTRRILDRILLGISDDGHVAKGAFGGV